MMQLTMLLVPDYKDLDINVRINLKYGAIKQLMLYRHQLYSRLKYKL